MPNMNGFEFLSVVRRRFPTIPVIVISGEFSGLNVPESVLADALFSKGQYRPGELFRKIAELLNKPPKRPGAGKPSKAAVWVKNKGDHRSHLFRVFAYFSSGSAAFEVGYESPSQFNREYKRFFGQPPMRDIQALRGCL